MNIGKIITDKAIEAIEALYGAKVEPGAIQLQKTKKEFEGDVTLVVFPLLKISKKKPEETGHDIGKYLCENLKDFIISYKPEGGFLNLLISGRFYAKYLSEAAKVVDYGLTAPTENAEVFMVEYSSPNTNKPLHLGHIRNNLLGYSLSKILKANGRKVVKTNIVNDRGIHICKSMLAWQKWGNGETPENTTIEYRKKGDHLVGDYYVLFDTEYKKQVKVLMAKGQAEDEAIRNAPLMKEAQELLNNWEKEHLQFLKFEYKVQSYLKNWHNKDKRTSNVIYKKDLEEINKILEGEIFKQRPIKALEKVKFFVLNGKYSRKKKKILLKRIKYQKNKLKDITDLEIYNFWTEMNKWVYAGFDVTYKRLGVDFDKIYYESDTYIVGRDTVLDGVKKNILVQDPDKSVWADLTADGLDRKILLRSDGTSVYMTQDIGTAQLRQNDFSPDKMIYVVGNEQNYHFKVLALILQKLGFEWAKDLYHMSYGMVELPEGKMKSREGTVVDADDLMEEMTATAREMSKELGKLEGLNDDEKQEIFRIIGLGALKYFILKVDPVKNMTFDPKESIDFNGNTGPFIQYTYARIRSVFRKGEEMGVSKSRFSEKDIELNEKEKSLLKLVYEFPLVVKEAGAQYSPALIANYVYELAKEYNQFYHDNPILRDENIQRRNFRLEMSETIGKIIKNGMMLLGIEVPERM
ncbi:MAG: arginine--tRNA ligase [Bacteroidales bacterium]|nr:arginine--tRNA ligase [Bacteroidales bacterium]